MKLLLDTHLLLWAAVDRSPAAAAALIDDLANDLLFGAASIWEIAIKHALGRPVFAVEPSVVWRVLVDNGYEHLPVNASHAAAVARLPGGHKDPFDRLLVAQAAVEGVMFVTADARLGAYPGPVRGAWCEVASTGYWDGAVDGSRLGRCGHPGIEAAGHAQRADRGG